MTAVRRFGYVLLAGLALIAVSAPAQAVERILLFISDVEVQRNGELVVTETVRVQAEGREIRRGILRDFPTTYTRRDGTRVEVGFEVQSVTRNGRPEDYSTERLSNGVRTRIGSADRLIPTGVHEYVITYRTTRQIGFFPGFDELYWNATGTGWTLGIDVAEARITLPERVPFQQSAYYTGPQGAQGKDAAVAEVRPGRIVFRTTRPLPPRNGLTVAAAWEKGVVEEPTTAQLLGAWARDNAHFVVAALGFLGVLGFYAAAWLVAGRDPPRGTIIPLFGPPEGMSAAAVRYVRNMESDNRVFTAAIVDSAVRGHLKITEDDTERSMERRDGGTPLPPAEQAMMQKLFGAASKKLRLVQSNHGILTLAGEALTKGLVNSYRRLFVANTRWAAIGMALVLLVLAAIVATAFLTLGSTQGGLVGFGMLFMLPTSIFIAVVLQGGLLPGGKVRRIFFISVGFLFTSVFAITGFSAAVNGLPSTVSALPVLAPIILLPLASYAYSWMKAHTIEGRLITDQIEGFRQYLGVAEEDRLEMLNPPEKTPELFEKFLPYAIALEVENTWAERFAGVLAAAAAAGAATAAWYSGNNSFLDNPSGFASTLGSSLADSIASASTPPGTSGGSSSSSGSSGGGSSGGGGGGGGGSGW